jgi:gliding motility-associated protein GldM
MGSSNCPETPRQKMIGMMYLVLTAMLALNVSKDILNAFVIVSDTVEQTNDNFGNKMNTTYGDFARAAESAPEKAGPYYKKAVQIREISDKLILYVANLKDELIADIDGIPVAEVKAGKMSLKDLKAKDTISKATQFFILEKKKAYEMAEKIRKYKQEMVAIVADTSYTAKNPILSSALEVDRKYERETGTADWAHYNFDHTVSAACYTLLNKTIGEIRNIEYETVNYLFSAIDKSSHKFDNVSAKVIPNSRIVFAGDSYEADIIVAAYDSRQNPTVYWGTGRDTATEAQVGSLTAIEGKNGVVTLKIPCSNVGDQKFAGVIKLIGPDGQPAYYGFKSTYTVTKPTAAVAAEKMNVFYAGMPNPVAIAAPVVPEKLRISWGGANGASLGGGKYNVEVPASFVGKEIEINVSAEVEKGRTQSLGSTKFRVKSVPEPNVFVGGNISAGKQPKDAILANPFISAKMGADFNYELPWKVVSYKVTFVKNGIEAAPITVNGAGFNDQVKSSIQSSSSGMIIEFSEIKISSLAGTRNIQKPIVIRVR